MRKLKFICVALVIFMLTSCGLNPGGDAKYLNAEHDVIIYEGSEYLLADGYVIHSRHLDYPSGNSADLVDYDQDEPAWLDSIFGGLGTFVFYSDNKTILYVMDTDGDKYYIRNDRYDYYISLLEGEEPPAFYLRANILRYATEESSSYREPLYKVDDELYEVFADAVYAPDDVMSYSEYSDKGKRIIEAGILHGGVSDGEFYYALCPFYYNHEFGFGIAVGEGDDVMIHLIPREYDEMIRESCYSEDGRFKTESVSYSDTQ